MQKIVLKYNPYKVSSTITVNGNAPKQDSELFYHLNRRFQLWVDDLPSVLEKEYNDNDYHITFYGTELDYQDLMAAITTSMSENDQKEKSERLNFTVKKMDVKEFGDKEKAIQELFEKVQRLPFKQLQEPDLKNAFDLAFNALLEVNVVATMSAGKSTLINALLGQKLMPTKSGACTATITKIQDNDNKEGTFKARVLDESGNEIERHSPLDYETMQKINANEKVSEIQLKGNIPFVTSDEVSLVLIDTPGPNNARNKDHAKVTDKALEESSKMLVIFVMDGATLHTESQDNFLKEISNKMSVGGKQSRERFLFVINKLDTYNVPDDNIKDETIPDTIKYLEKMGIKEPNVFPAAALPALLIREYKNTDDEQEKERIQDELYSRVRKLNREKQLHLEQYPQLVRSVQVQIDKELEEAIEADDVHEQALIHSGIRGIEESIRMYVTKYTRPAKIKNLVDTFNSRLDGAKAREETLKDIASRTDEQSKLRKIINKLEEKLTSKSENEAFKKKVNSLDIDSKLADGILMLTSEIEGSFTEHLQDAAKEIQEDEARKIIKNFEKTAKVNEKKFPKAVEKLLDEDVKIKSEQLLDEYIQKLAAISKEISKDGLEIDLESFVKGKLVTLEAEKMYEESIETRIDRSLETRMAKETRYRSGLGRLFRPNKWFDSSYKVNVERKFVNREKLTNQLVAPIRESLDRERTKIIKFGKEKTKQIKEYFYEQFDKVDKELAEMTQELQQAVKSKESSDAALKKAEGVLKDLDGLKKELEEILEI